MPRAFHRRGAEGRGLQEQAPRYNRETDDGGSREKATTQSTQRRRAKHSPPVCSAGANPMGKGCGRSEPRIRAARIENDRRSQAHLQSPCACDRWSFSIRDVGPKGPRFRPAVVSALCDKRSWGRFSLRLGVLCVSAFSVRNPRTATVSYFLVNAGGSISNQVSGSRTTSTGSTSATKVKRPVFSASSTFSTRGAAPA